MTGERVSSSGCKRCAQIVEPFNTRGRILILVQAKELWNDDRFTRETLRALGELLIHKAETE